MDTPDAPPSDIPPEPVSPPPAPIDWGYWVRRLLVCNPFFLCSAAVLLFGINRLSVDPNFLSNETQNLLFNFSALQFYEILVIGTAILLARRKIWYDSALLVVLENGLFLLPFMLISQAALIDDRLAWVLTLAGGLAAVGRCAAIKRWYGQFNLPVRALFLGGLVLAVNVALPRIFRAVIAVDYDNWRLPNLAAWYIAFPLLAAGANLLPRPARYGGTNPERHWLPLFLYGLWTAGTGVHIWSVGYIAKLAFEPAFLAPVVWVGAWTFWNRLSDCLPTPSAGLQKVALTLAFLAPSIALGNPTLFAALAALNVVAFLILAWSGRVGAGELALASALFVLAGMPLDWEPAKMVQLSRMEHVALAAGVYCVLRALRSRNPEAGLIGAFAVAVEMGWFCRSWSAQTGLQAACVFFLAHSLRWANVSPRDRVLRIVAACFWIIHSMLWTRLGWPQAAVVAAGGLGTVTIWLFYLWCQKQRGPLIIPISSAVACVSGPLNWFFQNSSVGLAALAVSLLLFAIGIAVALTRRRWENNFTNVTDFSS